MERPPNPGKEYLKVVEVGQSLPYNQTKQVSGGHKIIHVSGTHSRQRHGEVRGVKGGGYKTV